MTSRAGNRQNISADGCDLCGLLIKDDLNLGEWKHLNGIKVHHFCLLLSNALAQNGPNDDDGILGFLEKDIRRVAHRIKRNKCFYCKANKANIQCRGKWCRKWFHNNCGIQNGCLSQYFGEFKSFCHVHVPLENDHNAILNCILCGKIVQQTFESRHIPACCENVLFHRSCIQSQVNIFGDDFRCPLCRTQSDAYHQTLREHGIFIPEFVSDDSDNENVAHESVSDQGYYSEFEDLEWLHDDRKLSRNPWELMLQKQFRILWRKSGFERTNTQSARTRDLMFRMIEILRSFQNVDRI